MAGELVQGQPRPEPRPGQGADSVAGTLAAVASARAAWLVAAAAPLLAGLVVLVLFVPTLLPTVANWDTAEFQTVGPVMGTAHPTGYPAYVILGWLASIVLLPFGEPAYRMNLLQALLAAVAVMGAVSIVQRLTGMRFVAFATGVLLATTALFWRLSTHADPHMFHTALLATLFALLLAWEARRRSDDPAVTQHADRWLVAAAFVYGVACANHSLALLLAPAIGLFVLAVEPRILLRPKMVLACAGVLAVTTVGLFLELPIRAAMHAPLVYGHPETWEGFKYVVLAEQFGAAFHDPFTNVATKVGTVMDLLRTQLGFVELTFAIGYVAVLVRRPREAIISGGLIVLACSLVAPGYFSLDVGSVVDGRYWLPLGLAVALTVRPRYGLLSGVAIVATCWFAASYTNADITRYYLGPLLIAFTWAGLAVGEALGLVVDAIAALLAPEQPRGLAIMDQLREIGRGVSGPAARGRTIDALRVLLILQPITAALLLAPTVDAVQVRDQPAGSVSGCGSPQLDMSCAVNESQRTGDAQWLNQVMSGLPQNAAVISWWSYSTVLWYGQKVEGLRPDIFIADDRTRLDMGLVEDPVVGVEYFLAQGRPVFLIRLPDQISYLSTRYQLKPWFGGSVYEVVGRLETSK